MLGIRWMCQKCETKQKVFLEQDFEFNIVGKNVSVVDSDIFHLYCEICGKKALMEINIIDCQLDMKGDEND